MTTLVDSPIQIELLGGFRLVHRNLTVVVNSTQLQSLVAYIVLNCQTPQSKNSVAEYLWPNLPRSQALKAMDDHVLQLQSHLPNADRYLKLDTSTVQWLRDHPCTIDVEEFKQALMLVDQAPDPVSKSAALGAAIELYPGDLLPDNQDPWVVSAREELCGRFSEALTLLIELLENQERYGDAVPLARRLRDVDRRQELTFRRLLHLHVLSGQGDLLERVQRWLQCAITERGSLVFIEGVAGVGKTSLALICKEWAERDGALFASGRCYERGIIVPFAPWQDILTTLSKSTESDMSALPEPFGAQSAPQISARLIQAVTTYLHRLATDRPIVLFLDDLHWAREDTLNLLDFVTRRIESAPLLVIVTYRTEELNAGQYLQTHLPSLSRDRPGEVIRLTPLDQIGTTRMIEGHLGTCSPDLARYLHERAEGNPLFLDELLANLVEQALLTQDGYGRWMPPDQDVPVPALVQQVIAQRSDRLGVDVVDFLALASVVGESWDLAVVEAILNWAENDLLGALQQVLAAHIVEPECDRPERYRFCHGLIWETLYRRQLPRHRVRLHGRVARLLETGLQPEADSLPTTHDETISALAYHAYHAQDWARALEYSLQAGDLARRRYALHSAVEFYNQSLDILSQWRKPITNDVRMDLHEKLGEMYLLLTQREEALDAFHEMLAAARDSQNIPGEIRALFRLAVLQEKKQLPDQAEKSRQRARRLAVQLGDPVLLALNHQIFGHYYVATGELAQGQRELIQAEDYARKMGDLHGSIENLRIQSLLAIWQGQYDEAVRLTLVIDENAQKIGSTPFVVNAQWILGFSLTEMGEYERARRALNDAMAHVDAIGDRHDLALRTRNSLGYLYRELGDLDSANLWNRRALEENRYHTSYHSLECALYSLLDLAANQLAAGNLEAAFTHFEEFSALQNQAGYEHFRTQNRSKIIQAELALARKNYNTAWDYSALTRKLALSKSMPKYLIESLVIQGRAMLGLGHPAEAADLLLQAVELADKIGHCALRWKTRVRLAEALTVMNKSTITLYRQALTIVDTTAAALQDDRLRASFLGLPLVIELKVNGHSALISSQYTDSPPLSTRPLANLTARETEILRLVADGQTDRQIAAVLNISVRTVNTHVTHILNKSGSDNRTAAAIFAAQNGLL